MQTKSPVISSGIARWSSAESLCERPLSCHPEALIGAELPAIAQRIEIEGGAALDAYRMNLRFKTSYTAQQVVSLPKNRRPTMTDSQNT